MKKVSIVGSGKENPLNEIEDDRERYKQKRWAHLDMIARLQADPRFDWQIFMTTIKGLDRKFSLIRDLQGAVAGKIGREFPLELAEFIVNYLIARRGEISTFDL